MDIDTHTFQAVLADAYELDAKPVNGAEISDLSSVKIYDKYSDNYRTENFGIFVLQKFEDRNGNYYNLIYCEQNFPLNAELVAGMDHVEIVSFKRYELVKQVKPVKDYYLFRLIPHTVQGVPAW